MTMVSAHTLVVNLTRFGDLLQTQPVFSGLRQRGHAVGLVCLDNFAPAAELLRDVDAVFPLPGANLLASLDRGWHEALSTIWRWGAEAAAFPPTTVLNFTATLSGRLLASHVVARSANAEQGTGQLTTESFSAVSSDAASGGATVTDMGERLRGFAMDEFGFGVNTDPWTTFLQASTRLRGCSPFNLVDLYWMAAGLGAGERLYALRQPDEERRMRAETLLRQGMQRAAADAEPLSDSQRFVAFQLGASDERRRWPVAHFAALGDSLWRETGCVPVLLGSQGETGLAERYAALAGHPHVSLVGGTSLPELAAVLSRTEMLVSNDTGTMHLAAGLGVPVLAIFLATAQPWDTGPYREGACSLEPDMPCHPCPFGRPCPHELACRWRITADTAFVLAAHFLRTGQWAKESGAGRDAFACADSPILPEGISEDSGARIWLSRRDASGFMDLLSLSGHEAQDRTRWVRQQRHFYRQFLDRLPASRMDAGTDTVQILPPEAPWPLSEEGSARVADELARSVQLLHLLGEQGRALSIRPSDMLKNRFLGTWQRLQGLWDNSEYLNVLGYLWMCETQEAGGGLATVLALARQYEGLMTAWSASVAGGNKRDVNMA